MKRWFSESQTATIDSLTTHDYFNRFHTFAKAKVIIGSKIWKKKKEKKISVNMQLKIYAWEPLTL